MPDPTASSALPPTSVPPLPGIAPVPVPLARGPGPAAIPIPPELEVAAAARLVGDTGSKGAAGRRMVSAAALHGIDLSLMWGTVDRRADGRPLRVRQVCLAVPGSGRTAMLVLSPPGASGRREAEQDHQERIAVILAACEGLGVANRAGRCQVRLAQALPDPREAWAVHAFEGAGFVRVGELAYLRATLKRRAQRSAEPKWPDGITVRCTRGVGPGDPDREVLIRALDRSYIDTLDCPALCGLRDTSDILDSHRATGIFDPGLWWLVFLNEEPHGCMLLSHIPDHGCVELVYLGLSPELRGRGLGLKLMEMGIAAASTRAADHIACAVDLRNKPARRLYERLGFREFGQRVALVKAV